MQNNLLQLFPMEKRPFWAEVASIGRDLQEIRLRVHRPIAVIINGEEKFLDENGHFLDRPEWAYCADQEEMLALMNHICHYSLYAFEDELRQGFITVAGGHRVGVAGQVVMEGREGVRTIKHISYVNIRIAHQIKGAADKVLPYLYKDGKLKNTLIISPPGCGKTTLLRDIVRQVSDGNSYGKGMCVGVVDERSEIAGSYMGQPQNDIGMRTDVLDACPKALGMMLLLRSMSPQVIAIDELGGNEDMHALHMAASCGSKILVTIHGEGMEDVLRKFGEENALFAQLFECFLLLGREQGRPVIKNIFGREEAYASVHWRGNDCNRLSGSGALVPSTVCTEVTAPANIK